MKKRLGASVFIVFILLLFLVLRFFEISVFDFLLLEINLVGAFEVSNCNTKQKKYNFLYSIMYFVLSTYLGLSICFGYELKIGYILLFLMNNFILSIVLMFLLTVVQKEQLQMEYETVKDTGIEYKEFLKRVYLNTIKILVYPCLLFTSLYFLNNISRMSIVALQGQKADFGWFLITLIFSISMSTDTFAYLVGRTLKGPKLAPKISPNKTISGAIGGLVFGALASVALYLVFSLMPTFKALFSSINLTIVHILMIGIEGSIANQIGDLYESSVKRKLEIKDFGKIFPGHGGVMDRVDGLSFVSLMVLVLFMIALV
ncbi:MAG: phosphatidate cytidylyltransferase [Clostridia bacterium]|nr:phosphatidate cytidylyltransferase [Clostridia bacterium]